MVKTRYQKVREFLSKNKAAIRSGFAWMGGAASAFLGTIQLAEEIIKGFDAPAIISIVCVYVIGICGAVVGTPFLKPKV